MGERTNRRWRRESGYTTGDPRFVRALVEAVPPAVEVMHAQQGPTAEDWETARDLIEVYNHPGLDDLFLVARCEGGDNLRKVLSNLILTLATLAHDPGGVELFGYRFEVVDGVCSVSPGTASTPGSERARWN